MIKFNGLSVELKNDFLILEKNGNKWFENSSIMPTVTFYDEEKGLVTRTFSEALKVTDELFENELFVGIRKTYEGFSDFEEFSFSTTAAIEKKRDTFLLAVEPKNDNSKVLREIKWPSPFVFDRLNNEDYAVMNICQGAMFINGSPTEIILRDRWDLESGYNFTRANYMPWYGLVRGNETLMAQYLDPFDTGFDCEKIANKSTTVYHISHSQLGKIGYTRRLRVKLLENADYNVLAKDYRNYLIESGNYVTLKEKVIKNKNVEKLIGSCLIHADIYHKYSPECFDVIHGNITAKEKVVPFSQRAEEIKKLKEKGLNRAYLHLDGWIKEGYDNQHPDTFPPVEKAGGLEGMKNLIDTVHSCGFEFGIHDQYRDFYFDAPSYNKELSIVNYDGKKYFCSLWEGGSHGALNPMFSLDFVKRNFDLYKANGMNLDGAYLDVFSVIGLDESYSDKYPLTREDCAKFRGYCLENVRNRGLLIQSEEGTSWALPHLDFTHHMPYWMMTSEDKDQMIGKMEEEAIGIPIPVSSLVFHDCIVTPWTNDNKNWKSCSSAALMAILHGGIPYVSIDADKETIELSKKAMAFHTLVAFDEMVKHEYLDDDHNIHHSIFSSGYEVFVNTLENTYEIKKDSKTINL